jgi:hypothetical protein
MASTKAQDEFVMPGMRQVKINGTATTGNSPAFQLVRAKKITLQFVNNAAAAYTADLQASNDNSNWNNVPTQVTATTAAVKAVPRDGIGFRHYRLVHTGGVGTTDFSCFIIGQE